MQNNELISNFIAKFADLQRIIDADDPKAEAENQLQIVKATLENMGVATTELIFKNKKNGNHGTE